MRAIRTWTMIACALLPLLACSVVQQITPTPEAPQPTPTSYVAHSENESMLCGGVFRLTVIRVTDLSNAVLLTVEVENASDQEAQWSPGKAIAEAYAQDGTRRLSVMDTDPFFEQEATLAGRAKETGSLVFPRPAEATFRFYYPQCEPEYVTLQSP